MTNIVEFPRPSRRLKRDRRVKINLDYEQLARLDAEATRRGCSRSAVVGTLLADLTDRRKRVRS